VSRAHMLTRYDSRKTSGANLGLEFRILKLDPATLACKQGICE
jgi:hypothetical protein